MRQLTLHEDDFTLRLYRYGPFVLCEVVTGLEADETAFNAANVTLPAGWRPLSVVNIPCFCDRTVKVRNVHVEQSGRVVSHGVLSGEYTSGRCVWYTSSPEPAD